MSNILDTVKNADVHERAYKNGDIAYVRTTQEPVFVLNIDETQTPTIVTVRRPVKGGDFGVAHNLEFFFSDELASFEESVKFIANQNIAENDIMSKIQEERTKTKAIDVSKVSTDTFGGTLPN